MSGIKKEQVLEKLSQVEDPELGVNIVELGLIYDIEIMNKKKGENQKIFIKMTFTSPACPVITNILDEVRNRLDELKEADIEVTVVFEPMWSPEMMSERAKIQTGMM